MKLLKLTPRSYGTVFLLCFCVQALHADALQDLFQQTQQEAANGKSKSMYELGRMYELGIGVDKDRQQALTWYRKAAQKDNAAGAYKLGLAYYKGAGVQKDYPAARKWFKVAGNQGHKKSREYLARMYTYGEGGAVDLAAAEAWKKPAGSPTAAEPPPPPKQEPVKKAAAKPTPKPAPKPAPKAAPKRSYQDRILLASWKEKDQPAVALPSKVTKCKKRGNNLICQSTPLPGNEDGVKYQYQVSSRMSEFLDPGQFILDLSYRLVGLTGEGDGGFGTDTEEGTKAADTVLETLAARRDRYECRLGGKERVTCNSNKDEERIFKP